MKLNHLFILIFFTAIVAACNKENIVQTNQAVKAGQIDNAITACDQFNYSDTVFYPVFSSTDYIVKPLHKLTGTFGVFPAGLKINATSGNINITKSETGLKYIVWFVAAGTADTCKRFITISGVDFTDSIYTLSNKSAVMAPVYNANRTQQIDCSGGCEFDDGHDDDNGNGFADEPPAGEQLKSQGIAINKKTGKIDLKQSFANGAFGIDPVDGTFKDFVLNYRLSDQSAKTLNRINLRIYYYKNKTSIPAKLLDELNSKKSEVFRDDDTNPDDDKIGFANISNLTAKQGKGEVKCRPPYIIVTQN